jgi:hypothetical protein
MFIIMVNAVAKRTFPVIRYTKAKSATSEMARYTIAFTMDLFNVDLCSCFINSYCVFGIMKLIVGLFYLNKNQIIRMKFQKKLRQYYYKGKNILKVNFFRKDKR